MCKDGMTAQCFSLSWPQLPLRAHRLWGSATSEHRLPSGKRTMRALFMSFTCTQQQTTRTHDPECNQCYVEKPWTAGREQMWVQSVAEEKLQRWGVSFNHQFTQVGIQTSNIQAFFLKFLITDTSKDVYFVLEAKVCSIYCFNISMSHYMSVFIL